MPTPRELMSAHLKHIRDLASELVRWQADPAEQLRIAERIRRAVAEAVLALNRLPK
jgi:hypothetical protein